MPLKITDGESLNYMAHTYNLQHLLSMRFFTYLKKTGKTELYHTYCIHKFSCTASHTAFVK